MVNFSRVHVYGELMMYAVIGDLVGSRQLDDRRAVQRDLSTALDEVTELLSPVQALEPTVGDEFQGAFSTVADATLACLLVRLAVLPDADVRCGLGGGEVEVIDDSRSPLVQDGSAWWSAREALDELGKPRRAGLRSWYVGPGAEGVDAFLLLRDTLVDRLNDRGRRLLAGALRGLTQAELAELEGIGRPAVSQHFARGVGAVREAQHLFGATRAQEERTHA